MKGRTIILLILSGFILIAVMTIDGLRQVGDNQGYEPEQPIAFSHKIHAGDNQIQCMYCHFGAELSRHAGIPPASTCMNCHTKIKTDSPEIAKITQALASNKPIEWVKVHHLADFVYFNHSQHVVSGKISCQTCHGEVEKMTRMRQDAPVTMGWCLECHRNSDVVVHGKTEITKESDIGGQDCAKCHY